MTPRHTNPRTEDRTARERHTESGMNKCPTRGMSELLILYKRLYYQHLMGADMMVSRHCARNGYRGGRPRKEQR